MKLVFTGNGGVRSRAPQMVVQRQIALVHVRPHARPGERLACALLVGAGCLWVAARTAYAADPPGIAQFIKMRWPSNVRVGPDGTTFFLHDPDGIRQLYRLWAGDPQKNAVKLTRFPDGIDGYELSDDGRWAAVTTSIGGSEQSDLILVFTARKTWRKLKVDPKVVYGSILWRRDSQALAYHANDESPADFHIYLYGVNSYEHIKVMGGEGYHYPADFSGDGNRLVIGKYHSASYSQLLEWSSSTGEVREITPEGEKWSFDPIGHTADDSTFLVNTDYRGDLKAIHSIDLATGEIKPVLPDLRGHEIDFAVLNPERTVLAVGVNEDGYRTLHLRDAMDFTPIKTPKIAKGIVGNVAFAGTDLLYSLSNANTPGVVYRWNITRPGSAPVAITQADTQGIDVSKFRLPKLVHYPSFDGKSIPAFLYLPSDYKPGKKIPFLVSYHGGPESQFRPGFNRAFQYFLSKGYGIIAPNVRGSSGYGKAYVEADNYRNRHKSVKDGVWAAKYVISQGYTQPRKVAAWGGSYGGFMTMAVITEAPELFGAACNVVGIVNFQTFLEQTGAYRRRLREAEYGPLSDPAFLKSISPIYKVDKITTPLMLAHGMNDPRVPVGEAKQVAAALKKRGVEVEELYFPDEGHGFAKEANRLVYYERLAKFFDKHLK